jgi:hypothetical protein
MSKDAQKIRERLKELEEIRKQGHGAWKDLKVARNQLAYLTAEAYVVIRQDGDLSLYGASREIKAHAKCVFIRLTPERQILITCAFCEGDVQLSLQPGMEKIQLTVSSDMGEMEKSHLEIWTFATLEDVEFWRQKQTVILKRPLDVG